MRSQPFRRFLLLAATCSALAAPWTSRADDDALRGDDHGETCCLQSKLEGLATLEAAKAFDEATGRDLRNFPPDRKVDFKHMKLQMRFDDLNDRKFSAVETLSFVPLGSALSGLTLDAVGLKVQTVKLGDKAVEFSQTDEKLSLRFDPPLAPAAPQELAMEYVCEQPSAGMIFTPYSPDAPHYSAEVHTQGETDTNRYWFICHDFPNVRLSTELIVDVPAGFQVSSNGKLVSNLTSGDRAVWHWLQEKPHVPYLVSLVIGKFDVVEIPHARVPLKVWVPQGLGEQVQQTYGRTGEMIDLLEKRLGVAYPWDRYDQLTVKNFGAGGMENTSATSMYPTAILDKTALLDGDLDGLIAHELTHQWTGDLITCKSWAHIWLNEGWATYGSALWNEQRFGEDGYLDSVRGSFDVAERDKTSNDLPMVSPVYERPWETFRRAANPYPKGASILHMLRRMLGEDAFWKGVHLYMNRHALGVVETSDLRYAMEEASGLGLEWFFEQWCYRPGTPELDVKVRYDGETRELFLDVQQKQKIDAATPAFRFTLPVYVKTAAGEQTLSIPVTEKATSFRTVVDGPPGVVAVDPYLNVLKTITTDKPANLWQAQARQGPTIAARHEAVEALGKTDTPDHVALLSQIIRDGKARYTLRNTAVDALAGYGSPQARQALLSMIKEPMPEAKVRVQLVRKLRGLDKAVAVPLLADFASKDESYAVRVAAIDGLAHHKAADQADLIAGLVGFKSQHDQVRTAALKALADLDDPRGLELAIQAAAYGHVDRSRPPAIEVIGKLAKHDKERAATMLLGLLNDPEARSVSAAGWALADMGEERAIEPIKAMAQTHPSKSMREQAQEWLAKLEKKDGAPAPATPRSRRGRSAP